jgi:hypothetical protein
MNIFIVLAVNTALIHVPSLNNDMKPFTYGWLGDCTPYIPAMTELAWNYVVPRVNHIWIATIFPVWIAYVFSVCIFIDVLPRTDPFILTNVAFPSFWSACSPQLYNA